MDFFINPKISVKPSSVHGIGILAVGTITKGEVLEYSPILELSLPLDLLTDKVLRDYVFLNKKELPGEFGPKTYLGLGYISLYNHRDQPNSRIVLDYQAFTATITAKQNIEKGEEIFISYGSNYFKFRKQYSNLSEEVKRKILEIDKAILDGKF